MHAYMRAIGLTEDKVKEYDVDMLCDSIYDVYDRMESVRDDKRKVTFMEMSRDLGLGIGIKILGEQDRLGFHRTSYFPYVETAGGLAAQSDGSIGIQKKQSGDSYIGVCNDGRVGAPLIFTLQNPGMYLRGKKEDPDNQYRVTTTFGALSTMGRIILPAKSRSERKSERPSSWTIERADTIEMAKLGDEKAIQLVTFQNLDLYSMVQKRLGDGEDIFSIVDTYFIPYGMESDQYHILANIDHVFPIYSTFTNEKVWKMNLDIGGLKFNMCINALDLEGEPMDGMRFRGDIWMQGKIDFWLPSADRK